MWNKNKLAIVIVILLFGAVLIWIYTRQEKHPPASTDDNSVKGIMSDIVQYAPAILGIQASVSSTSFWVTHDGYMAIVPNQAKLQSYIDSPHDVDGLLKADQELTDYVSGRLGSAGYTPDPDNTSTSTDNVPFNTLRIAFVSSDGESRCVIKPPDPTQAQLYISWSFACVNTTNISDVVQNEMPFLEALDNLKGAAITYGQQGTFAAVGVFGEMLGYYNAIMIETSQGWRVIYKGQAVPACSLMKQYQVPASIYGQCS